MAKSKQNKIRLPFRRAVVVVFAALIILFSLIFPFIAAYGWHDGESKLGKGEFAFKEYVGTLSNPGVGYTTTDWYHTKVNGTVAHDKRGDIVLFFIDLGPFSSGINGTTDSDGKYVPGVDYDLDDTFFAALDATFDNCRKNGSTIALRFRYDENGKADPEPEKFQNVLDHIAQIKASGVLEKYKDILMFVESGFVGKYGEQHGGKFVSVEYKARLLEAMLDCVPSPIPVTVRTPDTFAAYVGIARSELKDYVAPIGSDAARVGLYNDGYMGSDSDLGTYADRKNETEWLGNQTLTSYFGGEFSGDIDFAKKHKTYLPQNCIPEMYKTHLSYINGNIFQLYKKYKFGKKYDVEGYDNSAYYGKSVFDFIRDHLGYRFVLKKSKLTPTVERGGVFTASYTLVNNGFANPVKKFKSEILFEKDGVVLPVEVDTDPTVWYSGKTVTENIGVDLPDSMASGRWNVRIKFSYGNTELSQYSMRSVRFANKGVWEGATGSNYIGYFDVVDKKDGNGLTDNNIGVTESDNMAQARYYNFGDKVSVDGVMSSSEEWSDDDVCADDGKHKLYVKCDTENLYVMSNISHKSAAPVFNLRAETSTDDKSFWLYVMSSGSVYFNREAETGHVGMLMSYSSGMFEFKIPFYMFGLKNGDSLTKLSAFVQDSADGWKSRGSIATENITVASDFTVYNALETATIVSGGNYELKVFTDFDTVKTEWLHDGNVIPSADGTTLSLNGVGETDSGLYSVRITADGVVKTVDIAQISVVGGGA